VQRQIHFPEASPPLPLPQPIPLPVPIVANPLAGDSLPTVQRPLKRDPSRGSSNMWLNFSLDKEAIMKAFEPSGGVYIHS